MDAILQMPMDQVLENVAVDRETKAVLQGRASSLGTFYQLLLAQEAGQWQTVSELAHQLRLDEVTVAETYCDAVRWAQQVSAQG